MIPEVLGAGAVAVAVLIPPSSGGKTAERPPAYAAIVEQYRGGDSDGAIRQLLARQPPEVARFLGEPDVSSLGGSIIEPGRLPAAIMLHTEAGLRRNWERRWQDADAQWLVARWLARTPARLDHAGFLRAWYLALGQFFLGSYRDRDAAVLLEQGRARFPDDLSLALVLGRAYEIAGTFSAGKMRPAWADLPPSARPDLGRAASVFRSVLAADPECAEARLHLGRVLQLSLRTEAGFLELERVAATANAAPHRYLARLFLGDQLMSRGEIEAAREQLEGAIAACPRGQGAALSLAQILHAQGHRQEAADVLQVALSNDATEAGDPFRVYYYGDRADQREGLERVKAMAQGRR